MTQTFEQRMEERSNPNWQGVQKADTINGLVRGIALGKSLHAICDELSIDPRGIDPSMIAILNDSALRSMIRWTADHPATCYQIKL